MGFNDDGLGAAMGASLIEGAANRAEWYAKDARALLAWALDRIEALEKAQGIEPSERPDMPSEIEARRLAEMRAKSYGNLTPQTYQDYPQRWGLGLLQGYGIGFKGRE